MSEAEGRKAIPVVAWLIERGQRERQFPTLWWAGSRPPLPEWTPHATRAVRYTSRLAAQKALIQASHDWKSETFGHVTEHVFLNTLSESADAPGYIAGGEDFLRRTERASEIHVDDARRTVSTLVFALDAEHNRAESLERALEESLQLQAHYAGLLNQHDGGQRRAFPTVEAWLQRLTEMRPPTDEDELPYG